MTSWQPEYDVELSDSSDDEGESRNFKGREAQLFVIDAGLFDNEERFTEALQIVRSAFLSALLVNDKDLLGIVFANTQHSPAPIEAKALEHIVLPENCAVFQPLRQLSKAVVEHFLQFIATAPTTFGQTYGYKRANYANMLRLCCNLFEQCGYNLNYSMVVYLTDCPQPHETHRPEYQRALQKAADLAGKELEFYVIPMVDDFDYELFYREFMSLAREMDAESFVPPDAGMLRAKLADRKLKQDFVKRTLGHFKLLLGADLSLSVQYYNHYKLRSFPRKVQMLRVDNTVIKRKRVIVVHPLEGGAGGVDTDSAIANNASNSQPREVSSMSGWYELNVGLDSPVRISIEQVNRVRNLHAPGMLLLGFKPRSALPDNLYYKQTNFMYPDDKTIAGSKRLFSALWQRCLEREKIAVCLFLSKRKGLPRYVALVPTQQQQHSPAQRPTDEYKFLLSSDGFKIIYLPFGKHIRHTDFGDWNSVENAAPTNAVDVFAKIIKRLRVKYQPSLINDPQLELLQARLLALALDIKTENGGRTEMPDATQQDARIAKLLPDLCDLFGEDAATTAKKRAASSVLGSEPKMAKTTDTDVRQLAYVQQMVANKTLASCTVAQLRIILDAHYGVKPPAGIKKQELIDDIMGLSV